MNYKKLIDEFGVNPSVFNVDTYDKICTYIIPSRAQILLSFLLLRPYTKRNIDILKNILKNPNKDGYILMDDLKLQPLYNQILSHEFVHANQQKVLSWGHPNEMHGVEELEADIVSTEFNLRNGIDVLEGIKQYKECIENIKLIDRLKNFRRVSLVLSIIVACVVYILQWINMVIK